MELVVDRLIEFSGGKEEELRDISALGTSRFAFFRIELITKDISTEDHHRRVTT